jgi:hypothetical protein
MQLLQASIRAAKRGHCRARAASPRSGAVVRDFKKHAFPMAEERWSVAVAGIYSTLFGKTCKHENQMIVTRDRTS